MKTFILIIVVIIIAGGLFLFINSRNQDKLINSIDKTEIGEETVNSEKMMESGAVYKFESRDGVISKVEGDDQFELSSATFQFTGFGPGKSHVGTFKNADATVEVDKDGNIIGGAVSFEINSIDTGIADLDTHLKSDDFFSAETNPEVTFKIKSISENTISGDLSFLGVTKSVNIPAVITKTESSTEVRVDTVIDISEFGFKFTGIKQEVRVEASAMVEKK